MKRTLLLFATVLSVTPLLAQDKPPIEGVWKIVEWVEGARTLATVQPSLFIFTKSHYSMLFLQTAEPRPGLTAPQSRQNLTDAEKLARFEHWRPFTAASGTYQVSGTAVTLRPIIAKDNWAMSEQAVQSIAFQLEGVDTLVVRFAPAIGIRVKLVRVE